MKKRLKNESNIQEDKIILLKSDEKITSKLLFGKKPPEEIIVIDKLKESNVLKSINFKNIKITNVINE